MHGTQSAAGPTKWKGDKRRAVADTASGPQYLYYFRGVTPKVGPQYEATGPRRKNTTIVEPQYSTGRSECCKGLTSACGSSQSKIQQDTFESEVY